MRKVIYAGGVFYTSDVLAEALLEYGAALARRSGAAAAVIPGRTPDGVVGDIEILIGPASQLMSEPMLSDDLREINDSAAAERLRRLTVELAPSFDSFELPFSDERWEDLGGSS